MAGRQIGFGENQTHKKSYEKATKFRGDTGRSDPYIGSDAEEGD